MVKFNELIVFCYFWKHMFYLNILSMQFKPNFMSELCIWTGYTQLSDIDKLFFFLEGLQSSCDKNAVHFYAQKGISVWIYLIIFYSFVNKLHLNFASILLKHNQTFSVTIHQTIYNHIKCGSVEIYM